MPARAAAAAIRRTEIPRTLAVPSRESVIVALFGTIGGLGIGVFFGWALVKAAADQGFSTFRLPFGSLIAFVILGAGAGVVAAWLPSRRAAKLDVLQAIATQ